MLVVKPFPIQAHVISEPQNSNKLHTSDDNLHVTCMRCLIQWHRVYILSQGLLIKIINSKQILT